METLIKELGYEGGPGMGGRPTVYFTAAECAEIARAYARSIATEARATWMSESKHEIAREELNAWRAKFEEWEGK